MDRRASREGRRVRIALRCWGAVGVALFLVACGRVVVGVGAWTATCEDVGVVDCAGVTSVFVESLGRREDDYLDASGGILAVVPRPTCEVAGAAWSPRWTCWEASAPVRDGRVCMVIGQQPGGTFAQIGGHDVRGLLRGSPARRPMCR